MSKTKMIWEMKAGDIGRLRNKDKSLIFCQETEEGGDSLGVIVVRKGFADAWMSDFTKDGDGNYNGPCRFFALLRNHTVDLLDFKLK